MQEASRIFRIIVKTKDDVHIGECTFLHDSENSPIKYGKDLKDGINDALNRDKKILLYFDPGLTNELYDPSFLKDVLRVESGNYRLTSIKDKTIYAIEMD